MKIPFFSWLFILIPIVYGQCLDDQKSLLLQLQNSLHFDQASSTKLLHWNQSVDCCLWKGVYCSNGRVIGLDMSNESFSAGLDNSSSLFGLQYLQNLSLAYNNFNYSQIPSEFERLTNLRCWNLSNAGFSGQIPIAILHLTRLVILDLSSNPQLHGSLPYFPRDRPLRTLVLSKTNFSGTLSDSIANLTMLSRIDFSSCNFQGSIPNSMANLTQLLYLDMSMNHFIGSIPSFSMAKNLTQINLSQNHLTGQITSTRWEVLLSLVNLDLSNNSLGGSIPLPLFSLPSSLQKLQLSNNKFPGQLHPFSDASSLRIVDFSSNRLQGQLPILPQFVTYLNFSRNNFSAVIGKIPRSICDAKHLKVLDLFDNSFEGIIPKCLIEMTETLEVLNLGKNSLNGTISNTFPSNCSLQTLDLNGNQLEGKLPKSLENCRELRVMDIGNNRIGDALHVEIVVDWKIIFAELGFINGLAYIILPYTFSKRWRIWYSKQLDDIISYIFPKLIS